MLLPAVLLTPMILAAEPVRLEVPDRIYDHGTQTSTFKGDADKRMKLAYSGTQSKVPCGNNPYCGIWTYDKDTD